MLYFVIFFAWFIEWRGVGMWKVLDLLKASFSFPINHNNGANVVLCANVLYSEELINIDFEEFCMKFPLADESKQDGK